MVLKCRIILASGPITLPTDWDGSNCLLWAWGPGGKGGDQTAFGLSSAGGAGAGGFKEALNVGGSPGDIWDVNIGAGSGGATLGNATFIKTAALVTLVNAPAGANAGGTGGFGSPGGGGDANTVAGSNSGGHGKAGRGGGGGGSAAGPHTSNGRKGGDVDTGFGGAGGAGAVGDFVDNDESQATNGNSPSGVNGADGGVGYYGTGAGVGGALMGGDGDTDTGGGGAGGASGTILGRDGFDGGSGASWEYILGLTPDEWIVAPFSWTTTGSARWAELSNGSVPGGGGGGGGGRLYDSGDLPGNGGPGGFPGGGGGGGGFGIFPNEGRGGDGADGLLIIFYEGEDDPDPEPEPDIECGVEDEADEPTPAITWPKCDLVPEHINVEVVAPTVSPGRSLTSREQVVQPDAGFWGFELIGIPVWTVDALLMWREIESALNGRNGTILIPFYDAPLSGTPIIASSLNAYDIGAVRLEIVQAAGAELRGGMDFSIGERGYRIKRVFGSEDGIVSVLIWPPLRDAIEASDAIEFNNPVCRCRLASDDAMNINLELLKFAKQTVALVEDV